jgi:hypothetical protein
MLVHERVIELLGTNGVLYDRAFVHAEPQRGGTWQGFIAFVSVDGEDSVETDRETTQSTADGVLYWATGLELTYFQGALERALRRADSAAISPERVAPPAGGSLVSLRLRTIDPMLPFRVMAKRSLAPGARRYIHNGGILVFRGPLAEPTATTEGVYEFSAQFGSESGAVMIANRLFSDLRGSAAALEIDGLDVPIRNGAIKEGLLRAVLA